jgi:hypothetical protein
VNVDALGNRTAPASVEERVQIRRGVPFRGSAAIAAGAVTRGVLHGPGFDRLLPDVHVTAGTEVDLVLLSRAAAVLVGPRGVLSGFSAAEVLGASCAPLDAPADVTLWPGRRLRSHPRLRVHRDALAPADVVRCRGLLVTSPARTATDLARWAGTLTEAVVAADALCRRHDLDPATTLVAPAGARGAARLPDVRRLADPSADSPMETRIRLAIVLAGLPPPVLQHPVLVSGHRYLLDLSYPELKLVFEFDGAHHRTARQARHDLDRQQRLAAAGWRIVRFSAAVVLGRPDVVAATVAREVRQRCGV